MIPRYSRSRCSSISRLEVRLLQRSTGVCCAIAATLTLLAHAGRRRDLIFISCTLSDEGRRGRRKGDVFYTGFESLKRFISTREFIVGRYDRGFMFQIPLNMRMFNPSTSVKATVP